LKVRCLLDENLPPHLKVALRRRAPAFDILRVGEEEAPPFGTLDPEVLHYLASARRLLLTNNRASMPEHAARHLAQGHHHWGIFRIRPSASMTEIIDACLLLWEASDAEEWLDALEWLPFD
jgi:hypothetical protein